MLMQVHGPRDIVIYWAGRGHFLLCKSPGAGHTFWCKSPEAGHTFWCKSLGVPGGGGMVTGQIDTCIMGSQRCPPDSGFSVNQLLNTRGNTGHDHSGRGPPAIMGYPGMCHFYEYTFCPTILEQDINFEKKFFVEHVMESENQAKFTSS